MNVVLLKRLRTGWAIDLSTVGNILRICDGEKTHYVAVFGGKADAFGLHDYRTLSEIEGRVYSFKQLVTAAPDSPPELALVLVTLQEGDEMDTETLELLEIGPATYVVDAFVRGMELMFFQVLRHDQEEFKLLGLIGPKRHRP